jgi:hypothetical protein
MIRIKVMVCRYAIPKGSKIRLYTAQVVSEAMDITKITAKPIPTAESMFLETPIKGHNPRNWVKIKFSINTKVMIIAI